MRFDIMTTTIAPSTSLRSVVGWTAAIGAVWIVAALLRPETTLHLGPIFLPLLPAFLLRGQPEALKGLVSGIAIGAAVIALLWFSGNLDGPSLEPFNSAIVESVVFLGAAAVVGLAVVLVPRARR